MYSCCLSVKNVPNWLFSVRMLQIHQKDPLGFNYPVYVEEEESLRKTDYYLSLASLIYSHSVTLLHTTLVN